MAGLVVFVTLAVIVPATSWALGQLTQKPGKAGCISEDVYAVTCQDGRALGDGVAVSPDGRSVYVSSHRGIAIIDRDAASGALVQKAGTSGCISDDGSGGACQDGTALSARFGGVAVSPDGRSVYVSSSVFPASAGRGAIAILDRDTATGALTQKAGLAGCVSDDGAGGACQDGSALSNGGGGVAVSPDGRSVYVASTSSVAIFDRDTTTGALAQKAGLAGCVSDDGSRGACQDGTSLEGPRDVAVSPDGKSLYVASRALAGGCSSCDSVAIFDRDTTTGALAQKPGTAGCVSQGGSGGACQDGRALADADGLAVSPDGTSVYVAGDSSLAILDRDTSGALAQKSGTAGCVSETGSSGACQNGRVLGFGGAVAVSPDGRSVYVASSSGVAILGRNRTTGALAQMAGTTGCVVEYRLGRDCEDGRAVPFTGGSSGVAVSPDGTSVYISFGMAMAGSLAIFDRAADRTLPRAAVRVRRTQPAGRTITVSVRCRERCTVRVGGSLSVPTVGAQAARRFLLRSVTRRIAADRRVTIRLRVPTRVRRAVAHALRNPAARSQVRARLSIRVSDRAGNARTVRRTARIRRGQLAPR